LVDSAAVMNKTTLIERVNTEYDPFEDRIKLIVGTKDDDTYIIWLTQKLLRKVFTHLFKWLAEHLPESPASRSKDAQVANQLQDFAQQNAMANMRPGKPVDSQNTSRTWLVREMDIRKLEQGVVLVFKDEEHREACLPLNSQQLRQWLVVVYHHWVKAEWPVDLWPQWIRKSVEPGAIASSRPVH